MTGINDRNFGPGLISKIEQRDPKNHDLVLGLDPGISGAYAIVDKDFSNIIVADMPRHSIKGKEHIDIYEFARQIDLISSRISFAVIEQVHAMPKQGVTSTFRFGEAFGIVKGVLAANLIPIQLVNPLSWKRALNLPADKDSSRQKASSLFPKLVGNWARKKDHNKTDALLIGYYGLKFLIGKRN